MKTVCTLHLVGAVGNDPEVRFTPSGTAIASFSIATNLRKKNQSGEYTDVPQWHNCVAFGKLGEIVQQYVRKGSKLYVNGTIEYQQWDDQGVTKKATKIIVNELSMLSSAESGQRAPNPKEESAQMDDDLLPF